MAIFPRFITSSVRFQLILGVAVVHALLMSWFIYDQTVRGQMLMAATQEEEALGRVHALAVASSQWVSSGNLAGLQELVEQHRQGYHDLSYALVMERDGRVLAHTDTSRLGSFVQNLPRKSGPVVLGRDQNLVDVVAPVQLAGVPVGWVRLGLDRHDLLRRQHAAAWKGLLTAVLAIILGAAMAAVIGVMLTRKLVAIGQVTHAVAEGHREVRVGELGQDEVAHLGQDVNRMIDTLVANESTIRSLNTNLEQRVVQRTAELQRERRQAQGYLDVAGVMIMVLDWEARIRLINPQGATMLGCSSKELLGTDWFATCLVPTEMVKARAEFDQLVRSAPILTGDRMVEPIAHEHRIRTRTGSERIFAFRNAILRDEEGRMTGILSSAMDITDMKDLEERLRQARDVAESASRVKAEFLAVMSHEIRTPLNGVLGLANLLLDTNLDPSQRDLLQMLHTCGDSLLVLINDVLDFSKIEAGKLELEDTTFVLHQTIDDAITLVAEQVGAKQLELTTVLTAGIPGRLRGDPTRLRQILANLLSNAVKFTKQGTIGIRVTPQAMQPGDGADAIRLEISVKDTGIGISPEAQGRLFQSFTQADSSTTRHHGGTGLGLAICKRLVERMGGIISVESHVGVGSLFRFTVCLQAADHDSAVSGKRGMRVLMHVHQPALREALREQCDHWGMAAVMVPATEIINTLRAAKTIGKPFQILLIDAETAVDETLSVIAGEVDHTRCRIIDISGQRDARADVALLRPLRMGQLLSHMGAIADGELPGTGQYAVKRRFRGHVLVAEDNAVNQRIVVMQLKEMGVTCDIAVNGQDALYALSSRPYDLVFMDCQMPEIDGLTASRMIRKQEIEQGSGISIPIIAMTAGVTAEEQTATQAAGMNAFLAKPTRRHELEDMLARWLPVHAN